MQHTSASLTINENYDSDVRDDTETFLSRIVPEVSFFTLTFISFAAFLPSHTFCFQFKSCFQGVSAPWKHTLEGMFHTTTLIKHSFLFCGLNSFSETQGIIVTIIILFVKL